jgi:hypothetical protein
MAAVTASLAIVAGTAVLGVAAGYSWAALAPRAWLEMTGPGAASLINAETNAYVVADVQFCLVCAIGGVISGVLGYLFAVRKYGPLPMAGIFAGALAAAFIARWIGQQPGLATFQHLLATLPAGARLRDALTLGATGAVTVWPLIAGLVAGCLEALTGQGKRRTGRGAHAA